MKTSRLANIKIDSSTLAELKRLTGQNTGQKAVLSALIYFLREARQRNILKLLSAKTFSDDFDPLRLRRDER